MCAHSRNGIGREASSEYNLVPVTQPVIPPVRDASTVVLLRPVLSGAGVEVYWVLRSPTTSYLGRFHTVPGGQVDRADAAIAVRGADGDAARSRVAAARELFEEAGVLLARGAHLPSAAARDAARRALLAGDTSFAAVLAGFDLTLDADDLEDAGRWVTPPFNPVRFDTRFYLAWLPAGQEPSVWPGELVEGEWIVPIHAVAQWRSGHSLLTPPTLHVFAALEGAMQAGEQVSGFAARLRDVPAVQRGPTRKIELRPGMFLVPLEAPTLWPATHTNCYVVGGRDLVVVDPGSPQASEQAILDEFLDGLVAEGRHVTAVLVTHHHSDHWLGAEHVARRFGVPVLGDAQTADRAPVTQAIAEGYVLPLAAHGATPARQLRALHTPGHTREHLSFLEEHTGTLLAGDLLAGTGTVIIDPPDGDMASYLASLRRLLHLPLSAIFPGHGAPTGGARERIEQYIEHRLKREETIAAAVAGGARSLEAIVADAYTDVNTSMHAYAARSALAHLLKLEADGRVMQSPAGAWQPAAVTA